MVKGYEEKTNRYSAPLFPSLAVTLHPEPKLHLPLLDFIQSQVVDTHRHCANDFEISSCWAEKALFVSLVTGFKAFRHI